MASDFERRKHRRLSIALPMEVRKLEDAGEVMFEQAKTSNISLGGAYLKTRVWKDMRPQEGVYVSISVPRDVSKDFPYSRLVGKARIVRVEMLLENKVDRLAKQGIGIEFSSDFVFLSAVQP